MNLVSTVPLQVDSVLSADGWRPARQIHIVPRIQRARTRSAHPLDDYFRLGIGVSQPAISDGFMPCTCPSKA